MNINLMKVTIVLSYIIKYTNTNELFLIVDSPNIWLKHFYSSTTASGLSKSNSFIFNFKLIN